MSIIVKTSDFIGKYKITQNSFSVTDLQLFIDKFENKYLRDLLGINLSTLFIADITTPFTPPVTLIYKTIFNPFQLEINNFNLESNGIKEMLVGFIYFEYIRSLNIKVTVSGVVETQSETATKANWGATNIFENYNTAIDTYNSIQYYVQDNLPLYTLFNGVFKNKTSHVV